MTTCPVSFCFQFNDRFFDWLLSQELYNQSMTYLVRAGFAACIINYPKAPQYSYPVPQLSVQKALEFAAKRFPHLKIICLGDSAGANLALQAAANAQCTSRIVGAVSVYGMMERETCKGASIFRRPFDCALQFLCGSATQDRTHRPASTTMCPLQKRSTTSSRSLPP